jgi:glycosyltransferase involved in cell wall biosynthesis
LTSPNKTVRVNILTLYFYPDYASTGHLLTELAVGLSGMGCKVTVYTAHPTYRSRERAKKSEVYEGVQVYRLPSTQLDKNSKVGRILNSVSFFISALITLLFHRTSGPLLIVSVPPFLPFLGYIVRRLKGNPYVSLFYDVYPDIAVRLGYLKSGGLMERIWDLMNSLVLGHASRVIALSEPMKEIVLGKANTNGQADEQKFRIIHNWVDEGFIKPMAKAENWFVAQQGLQDKFIVLYSGNIGLSYDLETVIAGAERLRDKNMEFLFIGEGGKKKKLQALVAQRQLQNVRFLPYQPRDILPFSLTCSDVCLVALEKGVEGLSMPSKLYTILASGRPVIALVEEDSAVARIIKEADCGARVAQNDVDALVRVLESYYENLEVARKQGENGRAYCLEHFTLSRACKEYYDLLAALS